MKENFLKELGDALQGQVPASVYQDTMRYYTQYIDEEIRKGRSEKEVVESLGSGRILAKTVIDTQGKSQGAGYTYNTQQGSSQNHAQTEKQVPFATTAKGIAVIVAVLVVVVALAGIVIHIVWALLPLILIVALIVWLVKRI